MDAVDLDAFLSSGVLSEVEQNTTLPFFIGAELYGRFVSDYDLLDIASNTRTAIRSYLSTYEYWLAMERISDR